MADDEQSTSSGIPGLMQDFVAQLRGVTERLEGLTRIAGSALPSVPALPPLPDLRALPLPGAISAGQIKMISTSVTAQRRSIVAMKAQLSAFDEQLGVLERILDPLAEWSRTWADLEERLINVGRGPGAKGQAGDS